ncbi:MAG: hypothetical protein ACYDBB_16020 [Armatimonadota bacterium]
MFQYPSLRPVIICLGFLLLTVAAWSAPGKTAAKPNMLFIGKPAVYLEVAYVKELEAHGFQVEAVAWESVTPTLLRKYNTVVIAGLWGMDSTIASGFTEVRQRYITDYMKAGGGVLVVVTTSGSYTKERLGSFPAWLKRCGVDLYVEAVTDPTREVLASPPSLKRYNIKFAYADAIAKHPATEGVKNIWFPTGMSGHCAAFAVPLVVSHQWQPLISTSPGAKLVISEDVWKDMWRTERPDGPYPLFAVRSMNLGRLAVLGIDPLMTIWSPYHSALGSVVMKQGEGGKPSDMWRLLENTYRWLAAPSLQMGIYGSEVAKFPPVPGDTPGVSWNESTFPAAPAMYYRGTVGAHTALSTGKGNVKEWAEAAKKAGFDFIIFTEDLAAMNAEKWKQLQAECKGATTADFIAYPGIEYQNAAGTRGFSPLGNRDWLPKEWLTDDGKMLNIDRGWTPEKGWAAKTGHQSGQIMFFLTWQSNGYFDFAHGPTPSWDHKLYCYFPVWSAQDTKPLDNALQEFLHANSLHVNPAAYALDLLYNPADLASAIKDGRPHLVVSADSDPRVPEEATLQSVFNRLVVSDAADGLGAGSYRGWAGPVATQGPAMRWMFRGGYQWDGVEFPRYWIERYAGPEEKDWYMSSWYRLKVRLDTESVAGIKSVTIYDGEQVFRRFDAGGKKQFTAEFDVVNCPTRHLVAVVTDMNGRQAVSREIWLEQQMGLYNYCGDRVNAPGSIYAPIHGHPFYMPETKQREVHRFFVDLVSPDLYIERYLTDSIYKFEELSDEFGWHNWAPHHLRDDYTYSQRAYGWYARHGQKVSYATHFSQSVYWDGFTEMPKDPGKQLPPAELKIFDNSMTLKKPAALDAEGFIPRSVIRWEHAISKEAPGLYAIIAPDGKVTSGALAEIAAPVVLAIPSGAIVCTAPAAGAFGQSILWTGEALACAITVKDGKAVVKTGVLPKERNIAGQSFAWHTETLNRNVTPDQLLHPKWFQVKAGTLAAMPLSELHVTAKDGVAVIELARAAFDTNCQPVVVDGVNRNWTAGYYEKPTGLYRPIGVWGNTAFVQVPGTKTKNNIIIGNIIRADQPEVLIDMLQETDGAGMPTGRWIVNANNPTGKELDVTFSIPAAFDLIQTRRHNEKIPAGAAVTFTLR